MKKKYIQPIAEISQTTLNTSILGISLDYDGVKVDIEEGGDDDGTINPESNRFYLWNE